MAEKEGKRKREWGGGGAFCRPFIGNILFSDDLGFNLLEMTASRVRLSLELELWFSCIF